MLNTASNKPLLYMRYGVPKSKYLLKDFRKIYDGIVVPANILLYQYKGTPAILYDLNQPFIVDPLSYLFAQPFSAFKKRLKHGYGFKPSFVKLMKGYGLDSDDFTSQDDYSLIDHFNKNPDDINVFINNCFEFQHNQVDSILESIKEFDDDYTGNLLRPSFLIPPYFVFDGNEKIQNYNYRILDVCKSIAATYEVSEVFPMIFIKMDYLLQIDIENFCNSINKNDFPGYCIWVDGFDERSAESRYILKYIQLISTLSRGTKQVFILYGGFFSMLLYPFGVNCISHGMAYSESRKIGDGLIQRGGPAPIRYYIPGLHRFFTLSNALEILRGRPDLICECPICKRILDGDPERVTEFGNEEDLAIIHFWYCRYKERDLIAPFSKEDTVNYLDYVIDMNSDLHEIVHQDDDGDSIADCSPLINWRDALKSVILNKYII